MMVEGLHRQGMKVVRDEGGVRDRQWKLSGRRGAALFLGIRKLAKKCATLSAVLRDSLVVCVMVDCCSYQAFDAAWVHLFAAHAPLGAPAPAPATPSKPSLTLPN
jgi:hypothetical protein